MKTLLIYTIITFYGTTTATAEFTTPSACESAAQTIRDTVTIPASFSESHVYAVCVQQKLSSK